ncbi:hypothetical protein [Lacibacter sediminis]|uniref:DUF2157 domain-containing protein n=1 Tax=Lacibacter sediminis TaxID=2760713 RepID=A0A7G5XE69_9BACT|nr:hypothetical protein [Lacibacter sediminis]QNA43772.1 hypothetical protein H4075_17060 [Lacibacter sediminis]
MIAYNKTSLHNKEVQQQSTSAFESKLISADELQQIKAKYPVHFYTPNFFIRIGLFILTGIVVSFSFSLFSLIFMSSIEDAMKILLLFFSLLTYAALEFMIEKNNHYNSGVDDALLWNSAGMLLGSLIVIIDSGALTNCILTFLISFYCSLRFADRIMGVIAFLSLLAIIFFLFTDHLGISKAIIPFVLMAASAAVYFLMIRLEKKETLKNYKHCFTLIIIFSLLSFYAAGNYYVVREVNNAMFHLTSDGSLPFGWLFWVLTVLIPILYIIRGLLKKDVIFLRIGVLLIAAMIFTIRYYHSVLPLEIAMTIAGAILLILSYVLINYLRQPRFGFVYTEQKGDQKDEKSLIESLVIVETLGQEAKSSDATKFGGGSFGGGGAGGEY